MDAGLRFRIRLRGVGLRVQGLGADLREARATAFRSLPHSVRRTCVQG